MGNNCGRGIVSSGQGDDDRVGDRLRRLVIDPSGELIHDLAEESLLLRGQPDDETAMSPHPPIDLIVLFVQFPSDFAWRSQSSDPDERFE